VDLAEYIDLALIRRIPRIVARLNEAYPHSLLGNKKNPVDELIYVLLSRQTAEGQYQAGYRAFRRALPKWNMIPDTPLEALVELLNPLGLARQKARALHAMFRKIQCDFGRVTLSPLRRWPTWRALNYLISLLGVREKTAKCVLMYCFGRQVLPVDTHTLRISRRLGFIRAAVPEWVAERWVEMAVPPELRFNYHIRCVQHGRETCVSHRPFCSRCSVRRYCERIGVKEAR
jgi:endonuclease III